MDNDGRGDVGGECARAERESWGCQHLLQHLCESEEQDRRERKMQRLIELSGLPEGKTLGNLDEKILSGQPPTSASRCGAEKIRPP